MNGMARAVAFSQDDDLDAQLLHLKGADLKRALRVLEERDARQRDENQLHDAGRTVELVDKIEVLPDGMMMLHYDSYLAHQRYYDDWKHADIPLLNFGNLRYHCFPSFDNDCLDQNQLVIQQQKSLGKGGLCWDAAFVLAEHLMMTHRQWYPLTYHPNILELGAGTGLSGLALAKFLPCNVTITDLPELLNLMQQNVTQNFSFTVHKEEEKKTEEYQPTHHLVPAFGTAHAKVLRWGVKEDYPPVLENPLDVIIGADIVATIYDAPALMETIYDLAGPSTKIYLSYNGRMETMFDELLAQVKNRFATVRNIQPFSRNRNPKVFIIELSGKIQ